MVCCHLTGLCGFGWITSTYAPFNVINIKISNLKNDNQEKNTKNRINFLREQFQQLTLLEISKASNSRHERWSQIHRGYSTHLGIKSSATKVCSANRKNDQNVPWWIATGREWAAASKSVHQTRSSRSHTDHITESGLQLRARKISTATLGFPDFRLHCCKTSIRSGPDMYYLARGKLFGGYIANPVPFI